jgi:anti-anti-sigma factor
MPDAAFAQPSAPPNARPISSLLIRRFSITFNILRVIPACGAECGPVLAPEACSKMLGAEKKMTTRITQLKGRDAGGRALLRVEGSLGLADAELLEKVCTDLRAQSGRNVAIDISDISFLDSDSASVLARLRREQDVALEGVHFFIQQVIEIAERTDKSNGAE